VSEKGELVPRAVEGTALVPLEEACRLLAEARSVPEVKAVRDYAEAWRHYNKQQAYSVEAMNDAAEIKIRAERRLGELLGEMPRQRPGEYQRLHAATVAPSLDDLGIEKTQSHRWQRVASVPEEAFEAHVAEVRKAGEELTTSGVLGLAKQLDRQELARQRQAKRAAAPPPPVVSDHWQVVQADCLGWLADQPEGSADLVLFSPPYEDRRTYNIDFTLRGEEWVAWMVKVVRAALLVSKGLVACVCEGKTEGHRWSAAPAKLMADLDRAGVCLRKPPIYRRNGTPGSGCTDWLRNDYEFVVCATRGGPLPWSDNTALGHAPRYGPGGEFSNRNRDGSRVNGDPSRRARSEAI
jgi:hypothetical protein